MRLSRWVLAVAAALVMTILAVGTALGVRPQRGARYVAHGAQHLTADFIVSRTGRLFHDFYFYGREQCHPGGSSRWYFNNRREPAIRIDRTGHFSYYRHERYRARHGSGTLTFRVRGRFTGSGRRVLGVLSIEFRLRHVHCAAGRIGFSGGVRRR